MFESKLRRKTFHNRGYHSLGETEYPVEDSFNTLSWFDERTGSDNPKWKTQIAAGVDATTSFDASKCTLKSKIGIAGWVNRHDTLGPSYTDTRTVIGTYLHDIVTVDGIGTVSQSLVSEADNEAKANFAKKLRRATSSFQGSTVLAELRESLSLIRNPAKALRNGLDNFLYHAKKHGSRRAFKYMPRRRKQELLADTWLEFQFGWRPLINDIHDGAKALAEMSNIGESFSKWESLKSVGESEESDTPEHTEAILHSVNQSFTIRKLYSAKVIYRGQVGGDITGSGAITHLGFDSSSWLPAIWEVVPWSFLIDYFTNIGDMIDSYSLGRTGLRWSNKTALTTVKQTIVSNGVILPDDDNWSAQQVSFSPQKLVATKRSVDRGSYSGLFVPDLDFSIPGFGTKWLNIIAIGAGRKELKRLYLTD